MTRQPDVLVIDRLTAATAPAIFAAAGDGGCVLTQIDTSLAGGEVFQAMADRGCNLDQISRVSWVITVHRVPAPRATCRQPHRPGEALLEMMNVRHGVGRDAAYYAAPGGQACDAAGYYGEVTVFDVFRAPEAAMCLSDWVSTPSRLSIEGYMARLAEQATWRSKMRRGLARRRCARCRRNLSCICLRKKRQFDRPMFLRSNC